MVKLGIAPEHCVVAVFAGRWKPSMGNRSRRRTVILLVARVAQRAIQRVVVVDMAIRTLPRRDLVGSGEREPGAVVIENCIQPRRRVVA